MAIYHGGSDKALNKVACNMAHISHSVQCVHLIYHSLKSYQGSSTLNGQYFISDVISLVIDHIINEVHLPVS